MYTVSWRWSNTWPPALWDSQSVGWWHTHRGYLASAIQCQTEGRKPYVLTRWKQMRKPETSKAPWRTAGRHIRLWASAWPGPGPPVLSSGHGCPSRVPHSKQMLSEYTGFSSTTPLILCNRHIRENWGPQKLNDLLKHHKTGWCTTKAQICLPTLGPFTHTEWLTLTFPSLS